MRFFQLLARPFVVFVERYYPDPFVFVVLLSVLTFLLSMVLADATPASALSAWGDGLPSLLAFTAQICITLLTAHALAHTDRVQTLLKAHRQYPEQRHQCLRAGCIQRRHRFANRLVIRADSRRYRSAGGRQTRGRKRHTDSLPVAGRIRLRRIRHLAHGLFLVSRPVCRHRRPFAGS